MKDRNDYRPRIVGSNSRRLYGGVITHRALMTQIHCRLERPTLSSHFKNDCTTWHVCGTWSSPRCGLCDTVRRKFPSILPDLRLSLSPTRRMRGRPAHSRCRLTPPAGALETQLSRVRVNSLESTRDLLQRGGRERHPCLLVSPRHANNSSPSSITQDPRKKQNHHQGTNGATPSDVGGRNEMLGFKSRTSFMRACGHAGLA
jgi:hypothetical protein